MIKILLHIARIQKVLFLHGAVFLLLFLPMLVAAQSGIEPPKGKLIPCNGPDCQFGHLIELVNTIVEYFFYIVVLAVVVAAIWAGFLLVTSGGNQAARTRAIGIFTKIGWGILWLAGGYLLIKILVDGLVNPEAIQKVI